MNLKFYIAGFSIILIILTNKLYAQSANRTLSNLTPPTKVNASLIPDSSLKRNLGTATKTWNNIYFDSAIYFDSIRFISSRGNENTIVGGNAMPLNRGGASNTAIGFQSLYNNLYGNENTAIGIQALYKNVNSDNTAVGCRALYSGGLNCTGTGYEALYNNSGYGNTADGYQALHENTAGETNTAFGFNALYGNKTGKSNVAIGYNTLAQAISLSSTVAVGDNALAFLIDGAHCTAVGSQAGYNDVDGSNNTYLGYHAGNTIAAGSSNTIIGYGADVSDGSYNNATALGNYAVADASNHVKIGNSSVTKIGGQVSWSTYSDARIKNNIQQNVPGLQFINLLKPVTYHYDVSKQDNFSGRKTEYWGGKYDIEKIQFTGFIAQDVEAAAKKISYDFSGVDVPKNNKDLYSLRYSDFVVPLVKAVQELSKQNDELEQRIAKLEAMIALENQLTAGNKQSEFISSETLLQNVPNPFNNSTTINYILTQHYSSAKIIITDKNGNALKQISLSNKKGSITVDAATLTSGAYQYSLYVDGRLAASKQMIISK